MRCEGCGVEMVPKSYIPEYKSRILCLECTASELD